MKKTPTFYLHSVLFAFIFAGSFFSSYASHIVGGDLYYTHVTGNTYKVAVALYGDCGIASAAAFASLPSASPNVCVYNGNTFVTTIVLRIDTPTAGVEVTPLCAGDSSQCTSVTSLTPGVKKFVYSTTYTFPDTSSVWRLAYTRNNTPGTGTASGRAAAITNIAAAASGDIQLIDTLNNTVYNNTSPNLTVTQTTFFCVNQHDIYNPGAVDPDSDSLSIDLTSATLGSGSSTLGGNVTYTGTAWPGTSVSAAAPLQVDAADSFSMNSTTGGMFFHPYYQRSVVVYNIREFRSGSFVGTSQREMTVLVVSCDTAFPCMYVPEAPVTGSGVASLTKVNEVKIYPNPTMEELTVNTVAGAYSSFTITDAIGKVFLYSPLTAPQTRISLGTLPAGLYYIRLSGGQGIDVRKFVKM